MKTTLIVQTPDPERYRLIDTEQGKERILRSIALTAPDGSHEGFGLVSEDRPDRAVKIEDEAAAVYWLREADGTLAETPCTRYSFWERVGGGWIKRG